MGKRSAEQIGKGVVHYGRGVKRLWKRETAKMMRRLARALGDDAPRRPPFRGWTD